MTDRLTDQGHPLPIFGVTLDSVNVHQYFNSLPLSADKDHVYLEFRRHD